jgi:hypothetical protein
VKTHVPFRFRHLVVARLTITSPGDAADKEEISLGFPAGSTWHRRPNTKIDVSRYSY